MGFCLFVFSSLFLSFFFNKNKRRVARRDQVKLGWAAEADRVASVFGRLVLAEGDASRDLIGRAAN